MRGMYDYVRVRLDFDELQLPYVHPSATIIRS
jgi:hypothetical protein